MNNILRPVSASLGGIVAAREQHSLQRLFLLSVNSCAVASRASSVPQHEV